jgi:hypothetical protein
MRTMKSTLAVVGALAVFAVVGVGSAAAHGGQRSGSVSTSALVKGAATQLNITTAKLKTAILDAANARIDEAVTDGDIEAADAADLKDEAADNLSVAYSLSRTAKVASNLSITTTQLDTGFRAARKALTLKKIDAAVTAGDLTSAEATDLKAQLDAATLPGYKQSKGLGLNLGSNLSLAGGGGHGGGGGVGFHR